MKSIFKITLLLAATCSVAAACSDAAAPAPEEDRRVPAQVENANPLPPDHPMIDGLNVLSRGPRRMSVAQLARSIETFGQLPAGSIVFPTDLARSLGQPDYLQTTEENLEPTPLFMKFMIDLGGLICGELAANDEARPQDERIFTRFTDRQDNLRHALRQATGIDGDEAAPYVERLQRVFEAGQRGPRGDISGYEAVCIALITSPEFLLY